MKKILCKDLGGPEDCGVEIIGGTFEELGNNSKAHVLEQIQSGDAAHIAAVERMKNATPEEQQKMFAEYQATFDAAPEV
jgi:hypothetical protein